MIKEEVNIEIEENLKEFKEKERINREKNKNNMLLDF